jgi:hydrophobic/amphiphilic exporter-1 (mainly G- bacteria), HAE1 family
MHLIEAFIRNPVKVSVGVLLTALFGVIGLITMPKQLTPTVEHPVLTVETSWPGASPQEIEREIVDEQEEQLQSTEGLIKMSSECKDSAGEIILEFEIGTNIEDAMLRVNTRLQQVREYPVDAEQPVIKASDITDRPIARFVLTARPPEVEQIVAFQKEHPDLAEALEPAIKAMNSGLRVYRLQKIYEQLGEQHPELAELLPPELDLQALRKFSEDQIETRMERVPGVADAYTYGGREQELQVIVDPVRLAARQITVTDVRNALQSQNLDTSAGDLWEGKRRWVIRTLGQFRDPEQVRQQVLATRGGVPIYIGDVADVQVGYKKEDSVSRRYGLSSNGLGVSRASDANVLEVMEGIKAATKELNDGILATRGLELYQYYDETEYIHSAIRLVQQNIFIGGALTVIVLLLFLHLGVRTLLFVPAIAVTAVAAAYISPWFFVATILLVGIAGFWFGRGALIVSLAIPISIIGTFLLLRLMGRSLNVISLAGLAFAVGMLVDNAVVVLENIFRRHEMGEDPVEAADRGTREVWGAVVASTLTTIAVFLPVLFVEATAGQLFRDIALAISCAVGLSLVVSFTVIPTAAARLFERRSPRERLPGEPASNGTQATGGRVSSEADGPALAGRSVPAGQTLPLKPPRTDLEVRPTRPRGNAITRALSAVGGWMVDLVIGINRWSQQTALRSLLVIGLLVGVSAGISWAFWPKIEYLPEGNRNFVFGNLSPPPGYNLNQLMEMGEKIEQDLEPYWNADPDSPEAEALDYPVIDYYFYVVRGRRVVMGFRAADPNRVQELIPLLKEVGSQFPGTLAVASQSSLFERGLSGGRSIDIEITGPELTRLVELGQDVLDQFDEDKQNFDGTRGSIIAEAQAIPRPSLDLSSPEIHIVPRLVEAAEMGISAVDLGYTVNALVDGAYAGDYFVGGDRVDMTIIGNTDFVQRTQDIESLPVATGEGMLVPLGSVADVRLSSGPEQINRRERQRTITIEVRPPLTMPLEQAMDTIQTKVISKLYNDGDLEGGYMVNLSGTADKLREAWDALKWNLILALMITYLLMAALFESWLYPFVIILSVPLGAAGGILGLHVLNYFVFQSLDVLTMLGFVILIGTVVNNAILIVHQSLNHIRLEGMAPRDAVPMSVRSRMRPIFITTMTTVLGLMPLVAFPGAGSELYRGLGSVVLGGLLLSTVFILILIPTVFLLTWRIRERIVRFVRGRRTDRPRIEPPAPIESTTPPPSAEPLDIPQEEESLV